MNIAATFNPALAGSGEFNTQLPRGGTIIAYNESAINLSFTFANGDSGYVPSGVATLFPMALPGPNIIWQQQSVVITLSTPISQVLIEAYQPGEKINGTFPAVLNRQTAVSNAVATTGGGVSTSVQNDGNSSNTSVVEATVSGDISSGVSLTNNGQFSLGTLAHPASLTAVGSSGNVEIDTTGKLTVQNQLIVNSIATQAGANLLINVINTFDSVFFQNNTVNIASVSSSGLNLLAGVLTLLNGSISRISKFTGSTVAGSTFMNHGLGATPDFVILMPALTSTPSAAIVGYDPASLTSTLVKVWASLGFNIVGLAIKF